MEHKETGLAHVLIYAAPREKTYGGTRRDCPVLLPLESLGWIWLYPVALIKGVRNFR